MENPKHFVLVHGCCHGAWCWYKIVALLKSAGHRATALDLGGCGVNPLRPDEIASISDYVKPLMDFMASLPQDEKVILVGHSYGGFSISLAMESFPEKLLVAVYVSGFMPNCYATPASMVLEFFKRTRGEPLLDAKFEFDDGPENLPISAMFGPDYMLAKLYQHCPSEDLELAKMLVKPTGSVLKDLAKESLLTQDKFGSVDRVFIVAEADALLKKDFQEWFIENSPPKEVKIIEGADHMVMLSKPKQLFFCFQDIAQRY